MMTLEFPGIVGSGELYLKVMKAICGDTEGKSMIDIMCYHAPYTPLLGFDKRTYVDIQDRGLDHKGEQQYFIQSDVFDYLKDSNCPFCDVTICSDGIEHLNVSDGFHFLKWMNMRSTKQVLFTPLGDLLISNDSHPDAHQSGWTPEKLDIYMPNQFAYIVFPNFHESMNAGAFFFWHTKDLEQDFERVKNELNNLL
jgi:hypothetical protein